MADRSFSSARAEVSYPSARPTAASRETEGWAARVCGTVLTVLVLTASLTVMGLASAVARSTGRSERRATTSVMSGTARSWGPLMARCTETPTDSPRRGTSVINGPLVTLAVALL